MIKLVIKLIIKLMVKLLIKFLIKLMIKFMINLMISLIIKLNLKGPDHQHVDVVAFPRVLVVAVSPHGHLGPACSSSCHFAFENWQKFMIKLTLSSLYF